jgi:hypothetical protein
VPEPLVPELPPNDVPPIRPDPDPLPDEPPRLPVAVLVVSRTVWVAESIGFVTEPPEVPPLPDPEVVVVVVGEDVTFLTVLVTVVVVSLTVFVGSTVGVLTVVVVVGVVVEVDGTRTVVVGTVDVTVSSVLVTGSVEGNVMAAGTLAPPAASRARVPSAHRTAIRLRLPMPIALPLTSERARLNACLRQAVSQSYAARLEGAPLGATGAAASLMSSSSAVRP